MYALVSRYGTCLSLHLYTPVLGSVFAMEPNDTVVAVGKNAVLRCAPPPSNPPAFVIWRKDNRTVLPATSLSGNLYLTSVSEDMAGHYQCVATNSEVPGSMRVSRTAQLTVTGQCGE